MRRRPQPNPRRGILRAMVAVVILVLLALAILAVVSSLTAPPAKAPTAPPTVGPLTPPALTPSSTRPASTPGSGAKTTKTPAAARSTPTPAAKKDIGLGRLGLDERSGRSVFAQATQAGMSAAASPTRRVIAYFRPMGSVYAHNQLYLRVSGRLPQLVGWGDALIPPVWSRDGKLLAYVRVARARRAPGAAWTLMVLDTRSGRSRVYARANAMNLAPAGWVGHRVLYTVSYTVNTALYTSDGGKPAYITLTGPQPLTSASLSPEGHTLAWTAPTGCWYCTVWLYNLTGLKPVGEVSGLVDERDMAWTGDGKTLVVLQQHALLAINAGSGSIDRRFQVPSKLPAQWNHRLLATVTRDAVALKDTVTGRTWRARAVG